MDHREGDFKRTPAYATTASSQAVFTCRLRARSKSPCRFRISLLVEDHSLVAVAKNAALQVPAHGAGEHDALEIAAARDQIVHLIAVGDARHILLDDGAVVEHLGDVMAGGADELDAAAMRRVIG